MIINTKAISRFKLTASEPAAEKSIKHEPSSNTKTVEWDAVVTATPLPPLF